MPSAPEDNAQYVSAHYYTFDFGTTIDNQKFRLLKMKTTDPLHAVTQIVRVCDDKQMYQPSTGILYYGKTVRREAWGDDFLCSKGDNVCVCVCDKALGNLLNRHINCKVYYT